MSTYTVAAAGTLPGPRTLYATQGALPQESAVAAQRSSQASVASAQAGSGVESGAQSQPPSAAELSRALAEVQAVVKPVARDLLFSIDKDSGKTIVKIVDTSTDEVIRQIPSEELIAIAKALDKLQGLLVKQEV